MLEKVSDFIVCNVLCKDESINDEQKEVMMFGVTRIIEDIPKHLVIFGVCLYLNFIKELLLVIFVTATYKTFVGGAHARTNTICLISSLIYFLIPIVVPIYFNISGVAMYILYALVIISSMYIIIKIAPADTEEIPILKKKRRGKMKVQATISLSIWCFSTIFFIKNVYITQLILLTLLITNIMATNLAYKIFKCKHSYESEEFADYFNK